MVQSTAVQGRSHDHGDESGYYSVSFIKFLVSLCFVVISLQDARQEPLI